MSQLVSTMSYLGEDGQWIVGPGHADLHEFGVAADAMVRADDPDLPDEELPSAHADACHGYVRPHPEREDCLLFCRSTDEGAEPVTIIETGA